MRLLTTLSVMVGLFHKLVVFVGPKAKLIIPIILIPWKWFGSVVSIIKKYTTQVTHSKLIEILIILYKGYDMFSFFSTFKKDVLAGFESVKQRIVTLEVKVEALFAHQQAVAEQAAAAAPTAVTSTIGTVVEVPTTAPQATATPVQPPVADASATTNGETK